MQKNDMKKYGIAALVIAAVVIGALALRKGGDAPKGPLVRDDLRITRTFARHQERDGGFLYLPYSRSEQADAYRYVNVAVDLNGDGTFAGYDANGVRQEEWLVRDMASFAATGGTNGFPVAIPDRAFQERLPVRAAVLFSEKALGGEAWPAQAPAGAASLSLNVRSFEIDDRDERYVTDGTGELDTGSPASGGRRLAVVTSAPANNPNEPYEYSARHEGIPDQNQKYNECSPTGISNNFRWLGEKYGFSDRLPDTTEALINELKGDLQWDNGVTPGQNTIDGKRAFIERRGLPLEAHLIGQEFDPNIQHKIYEELKKGQAVEVGMLFLETVDGEERAAGAHLVGVSGTLRSGGDRFIQLVDPGTGSAPDGSGSETYRLRGNEVVDYDTDVKTVIRFAYAQSPVFDGDGNLVYPDQTGTALRVGETPRAAADDRFTMARSNFGFFNVMIDDPGDHMVGETFTTRAVVDWTGRTTTMRYWDEAAGVRRSFTFGAGRPWTLRGHFIGSVGTLAPYTVEHRPDQTSVADRRLETTASFTCEKPGLAKIKYVAFLGWPRTGDPRPEGVWQKYRAQVDATSHMVTVVSAPFRCLATARAEEEPPRTAAPFTCPGVAPTDDGVDIEVFVLDGQCFPVSQFHVAEPDACGQQHWHWNGAPVVSFEGVKKNDPNTSGCGFGTVNDLKAQPIKVGRDDAAKFLGGVLER